MNDNPLVDMPQGASAIHIIITKPGAIVGTPQQRQEIDQQLPLPEPGKHWQYQPMAVQPLRFATVQDADGFLAALKEGKATDSFFVAPMRYDELRKKWVINLAWAQAAGELVVFVQRENTPAVPAEEAPAHVD